MRRMSADKSAGYNQVPALTGRLKTVEIRIAIALTVAAGVALRFWTPSALWLDEALTVNIARLPLHEIPARLKQDGAPPLFYYLLHFSIHVFGQSDLATRALAGVFGVLTLPSPGLPPKGPAGGWWPGPLWCWWPARLSPSTTPPSPACTPC